MSKYCLFLIVIYYLTGGNNSMSCFCKFGKLHVTKGNVDKLLGILLTASKELKRSLALLSWGSSDHMQDKINSQQHLEKWDESRKPSLRWITYLIKP